MSGFKKALDGTSSDGAISKFGDIDKEKQPKRVEIDQDKLEIAETSLPGQGQRVRIVR